MKETPNVVTPTASASTVGTPNPFAALEETSEAETAEEANREAPTETVETIEDIPDDEYLPNQSATEVIPEANQSATVVIPEATITTTTLSEDSDDLSLSSISTMGSSDTNNEAYSKAKIIDLMETDQTQQHQGYQGI